MDETRFDPGPLADVGCERAGDRWTLVFIRDLRHPPQKVWAALTEPGRLAQWAPYTADRDLTAPGAATITMIDGDTTVGLEAVVQHAEAPKLLEYTWGDDVLRWELEPTTDGTRLTLRHTVADQDWVPKVAAGWHLCLAVAEHLLDDRPIAPIRGMDAMNYGWEDLHDRYAEKFRTTGTGWPG
jgi:uncharacterized protein YndB with AHSA1/START domain